MGTFADFITIPARFDFYTTNLAEAFNDVMKAKKEKKSCLLL
jgi:hypothetical protein